MIRRAFDGSPLSMQKNKSASQNLSVQLTLLVVHQTKGRALVALLFLFGADEWRRSEAAREDGAKISFTHILSIIVPNRFT